MNSDTTKSIQDKIRLCLDSGNGNFLLLRHYNTLALTEQSREQTMQDNPDAIVCLHDYKLSDMIGVFEPFLDFARIAAEAFSDDEIDRLIDECNIYSLHRSVFKSFLQKGVCVREENLLIDEVEFEQDKIASAVVDIVSHIAGDRQIIFLLNDMQYANGSSMHFIHNLVEDAACQNIIVIATYNEAKVPLFHMEPIWDRFYRYVCDKKLVIEIGSGVLNSLTGGLNDFIFSETQLKNYITKINNLLFCLDFLQANYYLEVLYKMITIEEINIAWDYKCEIIKLYTLVSVYTQNFSQALLLCEKLKELRMQTNDWVLDYAYYYFMCMAHMYNGKLDEADKYAEKCADIAVRQQSDYGVFIAMLSKAMVKMSGWHNIFFCANDIPVDRKLIQMAQDYHFWNHLAHIYVYAYDNQPALFEDETQVENRLVYFNKGIDIMRELGNEHFMMEAYKNNVMIASTYGFFRTANYYYNKCYELVKGKDACEEAIIYNGVGYISSSMGEYDKAFSCYSSALISFMNMERIDDVGETIYNMALNCIMAEDYKCAYSYLELAFRIVKEMKMNSLRVCNISKLAGLLAVCSYYNGNELKCVIYIEKARLFLEHLLDGGDRTEDKTIVHDYTLCKDDLFIFYFMNGLLLARRAQYEAALKNFEQAENCLDESAGNLFYIFGQYSTEFAKLYQILGKNDEAQLRIRQAIDFYNKQGCQEKAAKLRTVLTKEHSKIKKHKLNLTQALRNKIDKTLRQASIFKENQEYQKYVSFLSAWHKMIEIGSKNKKELISPALNAFVHNFNIDRFMLVRYRDNEPEELFNNTGYVFTDDRRQKIEQFFQRKRLGFATSKMSNNYTDYLELISLFDKSRVCSFVGMPFYYNDSLKAVIIAYIEMKDNWHSLTNRYLLYDGDYAVFEFLMRQILSSIDMLEANEKIKQMNDKLNYLAITDKLTGLYNREGFYGNISSMVRQNKKTDSMLSVTIMYIDLDNFKYYNDTFGHGVGDIILIGMAEIFRNEVGDSGFVTRYGGDEFLITLYTDDIAHAEQLAKNIYSRIEQKDGFKEAVRNKLGKNIDIPGTHRISCSIGISTKRTLLSEDELENMVKEADKVLYDVKNAGKGAYRFYV